MDEEKTSLRKVQRYIPGFRGYSLREEMRDADRMLRMQLSQKIVIARRHLEAAARRIAEKGIMIDEARIQSALVSLRRISAEFGYADSAYSWMTEEGGFEGDEVNRLYEIEAELLDQMTLLLGVASELDAASDDSDISTIDRDSLDVQTRITFIEDLFRRRMSILGKG